EPPHSKSLRQRQFDDVPNRRRVNEFDARRRRRAVAFDHERLARFGLAISARLVRREDVNVKRSLTSPCNPATYPAAVLNDALEIGCRSDFESDIVPQPRLPGDDCERYFEEIALAKPRRHLKRKSA